MKNMMNSYHGQEMKTKMIWPCLKVFWISKDSLILGGTVSGKGKRGRQKKRWEDKINEWTGMDLMPAQLGQLKTGQDGKGLLGSHL